MRIFLTIVVLVFVMVGAIGDSCARAADPLADEFAAKKELADQALKRSMDLGFMELDVIKRLLSAHKFAELESLFEAAQSAYQKDVDHEAYLNKSFGFFDEEYGIALADLDQWIAETGSYIAYTARGIYYAEKGWTIRGSGFIKDVSKENLKTMVKWHTKAMADLQTAIRKRADGMTAYSYLIYVVKASSLPVDLDDVLDRAVKADPRTFYVRQEFIECLYPKWGGSIFEMDSFVNKEVKPYFSLNPRLRLLQGEADAQTAEAYWMDKDYKKAIYYFSSALKYGDETEWLRHRASLFRNDGQYWNAVNDYKRVLYFHPEDKKAREQSSSLMRFIMAGQGVVSQKKGLDRH